jgi:hypothetical protein
VLDDLVPALAALDDCGAALRDLDAGCCEPGRSPRMQSLADTLDEARAGLQHSPADPDTTLALLEDAGGQIGRLQVGCCAPNRLPLYERMLAGLTTAQIAVNRARGGGH